MELLSIKPLSIHLIRRNAPTAVHSEFAPSRTFSPAIIKRTGISEVAKRISQGRYQSSTTLKTFLALHYHHNLPNDLWLVDRPGPAAFDTSNAIKTLMTSGLVKTGRTRSVREG